jgi:uncharacterized membrane protein YqiK
MNDMTQGAAVPQTITIERPQTDIAEVSGLLKVAEGFHVIDDDSAQMAVDECKSIVAKKKVIEEERVKITKPLLEAQRATNDLFKKLTEPLERAERTYKSKVLTYQQDQERKRREEAAKAEEAARKERERLEKEAQKLEAKGKSEQAEAKREVAAMMPTTFEAPPAPTFAGFSGRKNWKARLAPGMTDIDLMKWVIAHPEYVSLFDRNESKLNALAKTHEGKLHEVIPALTAYNDAVGAVR